MELNRKTVIGATIGATIIAAVAAFIVRRRKSLEARAHVPIGRARWEDRQLDFGEWPGGFSIRPE